MIDRKAIDRVIGIFFLGSLWGLVEASLGDWLYTYEIVHPSLYLTTIAVTIVAALKFFYPQRWTGTLAATIAMVFKVVNVPFFGCHLLAIFLLGFGIDIAYEIVPRFHSGKYRHLLIGLFGTYLGRALFAIIITYVVQYRFWTEVGLSKVIDYIFITGTVSSLLSCVAVHFGTRLAINTREFPWLRLHPRLTTGVVIVSTAGIWMIQLAL